MQDTLTIQETIIKQCPTCRSESHFQHVGQQKWSEAVAQKLGMPTIINLYGCDRCHTTLTDIQLHSQSA